VERVGEAEGPRVEDAGLGEAGFASESEFESSPFRSSSSLSEDSDAVSQESTIGSAFFLCGAGFLAVGGAVEEMWSFSIESERSVGFGIMFVKKGWVVRCRVAWWKAVEIVGF
jgi:hypothetical protein